MAGFNRAKRVTDPFDDKVKARLIGMDRPRQLSYISTSGSEQDVVEDESSSSPSLSALVDGFFAGDDIAGTDSVDTRFESERVDSVADSPDVIKNILNGTVTDNANSFRSILLSDVLKATEVFSCLRSTTKKAMFRRNVMYYLRNLGHNAAICKSKWESSGGLTAGTYEYIDVVTSQNRYIVDVDFAGEFEIARPTEQYLRMVEALPRIYVGKGEEMKRIVKVMCDAAKRSLKRKDLCLPPWRKNRYMQMKWFGPYRRTANYMPVNMQFSAPIKQFSVECRSIGFDVAVADVNGRYFVRTR